MNTPNKIADLQKLWEQMPDEQLEALLQTELKKPVPDDDVVIRLLHILEAREPDADDSMESPAVRRYAERLRRRTRQRKQARGWLSVAASLILLAVLFISLVPQRAQAESIWEMLSRWGESVLQFWNPTERLLPEEYEFRTDNPGLMQVYEAVTEMGITDPVVPMWLPEGYELSVLRKTSTPRVEKLYIQFVLDNYTLTYSVDQFSDTIFHEYYKDDTFAEIYEIEGVVYNIARNNDMWVAVWYKENVECSIAVDCQEETLRSILDSIYTMEDD